MTIIGAPRWAETGLVVLAFVAASGVQAASSARIVETQPEAPAALGRQESFRVRIAYDTDEPINLWARPYRNGVQVKQAMSNASLKYTGSGEALGWFALTEPGEVDEIRVLAGGGKPYREWELMRQPVRLRWTAGAPSGASPAAWVAERLADEQRRRDEDARRRASEPVSAADTALAGGFMLAVLVLLLGGIAVPLWSVWKWRGGWRLAAAVPAALVLFFALRILVGTALDPTSHNLWPFEILTVGIVALAIVGVLKLARRFAGVSV